MEQKLKGYTNTLKNVYEQSRLMIEKFYEAIDNTYNEIYKKKSTTTREFYYSEEEAKRSSVSLRAVFDEYLKKNVGLLPLSLIKELEKKVKDERNKVEFYGYVPYENDMIRYKLNTEFVKDVLKKFKESL